MSIPGQILNFISENEVMTIATSSGNIPYCATVFYVYLEDKNILVFMSDKSTRHAREMTGNEKIAGTIIVKHVSVSTVQGLQLMGKVFEPCHALREECSSKYLWAYPMAAFHSSTLWAIKPNFFKLTDYRLGFGKKIAWKQEE
jgi:uncharacterized protein